MFSKSRAVFLFFGIFAGILISHPALSEESKSKATYQSLRSAALKKLPRDVGIDPEKDDIRVYGVLMDMAFEKGHATFVSYISGDAALYFEGDGVIDGGPIAAVRIAATKCVQSAALFIPGFQEVKDYPLPKKEEIRFYLLTPRGVLTSLSDEKVLRSGKDYLSPLLFKANEVITELRKLEEKSAKTK